MKQRFIFSLIIILIITSLSSCGCRHQWTAADCDTPITCTLCQATDGAPLGHSWTAATCIAPMTCSECFQTNGEPLPHSPAELEISDDYINAVSTRVQFCKICNTELLHETEPLSLIQDNLFLLNASSLLYRLNSIYTETGMTDWQAALISQTHSDGTPYISGHIFNGDIDYAEIQFKTPNNNPTPDKPVVEITPELRNEPIVCQLTVIINYLDIAKQIQNLNGSLTMDNANEYVDPIIELLENMEEIYLDIVGPVLKTCDPTISDEDIAESYSVFSNNTLIAQDFRGELALEYGNFLQIFLIQSVTIGTSDEFFIDISAIS